MTTGTSMKLNETLKMRHTPIPYFERAGGFPGLWGHINNHLQNKGRNATSNPYLDKSIGFTTTFYEIMKPSDQASELWRHGPLYDDPLGRRFRKCSYTVSHNNDAATTCTDTLQVLLTFVREPERGSRCGCAYIHWPLDYPRPLPQPFL